MISVIIPTCNRNDLLAKCLDCLAPGKQSLSFSEYEVIVTDDGKDTTAEQMLKEKYPWARWTQGPRKGPAANRNHGASQAKGEWLAFTDDDCLPSTGWLEAFSRANPSATSVLEGRTVAKTGIPGPFWTSPTNEKGGLLWSCNFMISRDLFASLGGFDEKFPKPHMEDVDFRIRVEQAVGVPRFVPDAWVDHPARKVAPVNSQIQGHLSSVYFCKKHNVPLSSLGLAPGALLLNSLRNFKQNLSYGMLPAAKYFLTYDLPRAILISAKLPHYRRLLK